MRDWANGLSAGPAWLIAERVLSNDVADYVRFRAVCRAWRAACTADPAGKKHGVLDLEDCRFHPRQWIMLPRAFHINHRRPFLNVCTGESIHVPLRDLYRRDHLFGHTAEGLLVVCRKDTLAVQLLNPLTGQRAADLPPLTTLLLTLNLNHHHSRRLYSIRVRCAGLAGGESTMVVALQYGDSAIAVAKPGDKRWTKLEAVLGLKSAMSFAGRFYCVTSRNILVVETMANGGQQPQLTVAVDFMAPGNDFFTCKYEDEIQLVDNGGVLTLVHCHCAWQPQPQPQSMGGGGPCFSGKYTAYQVKLDTGNIVPMHGLGGRTLFMGMNYSISISMHRRSSRYMSADTVYMCCNYSDEVTGPRPNSVVAIDLLGRCFKPCFGKEDIAHYLSSYVCA